MVLPSLLLVVLAGITPATARPVRYIEDPPVALDWQGSDGLDLRWRGVALSDLPGSEAALLATAVRLTNPAKLGSVTSVAWLERSVTAETAVTTSAPTTSAVDRAPRHLLQIVGRDARFATEVDPGTRQSPPLGVVIVEARLAPDSTDLPEMRIVRESPLVLLDLEIEASLSDRTTVVSDELFGFVRVWPSGVGAIDPVRRPGYLTSLTPATELGRINRATSIAKAPGWNHGNPFMPFEIPYVRDRNGQERRWYVETRVAFHIWQGRRFSRGFNSHGCITLREADLHELAAFVWSRPTPLALRVETDAFAEHRHPYPHETTHYWLLENIGTAERPVITRGNFYAIKKVIGAPPPVNDLQAVFMSWEDRKDQLGPVAANRVTAPVSLMP